MAAKVGDAGGGGTWPVECRDVSTVPVCICSDVLLRRTADGAMIGASRCVMAGDLRDAAGDERDGIVAAAVTATDSARRWSVVVAATE